MWVGKKQNFIGSAGVVGSHSVLIFFFVFVCRLVNFHVAVFFLGLLVTAGGVASVGERVTFSTPDENARAGETAPKFQCQPTLATPLVTNWAFLYI